MNGKNLDLPLVYRRQYLKFYHFVSLQDFSHQTQGYAKLVKLLFAEIVGDLEAQIISDIGSDLHRHNKAGGTL